MSERGRLDYGTSGEKEAEGGRSLPLNCPDETANRRRGGDGGRQTGRPFRRTGRSIVIARGTRKRITSRGICDRKMGGIDRSKRARFPVIEGGSSADSNAEQIP
jgi:hypothetical protein